MKTLKTIIYHFLMAFRGIFFTIFNIVAGILALVIVISLGIYIFGGKSNTLGPTFGASLLFLGIYFLKHFYDKIIFWAKPDDVDLTLYK